MKKIILIIIAILFCLIFFIFGIKNIKTGNNNINQDDVKDIFNMNEYEAEIEVTINSNKTENKYKIKQQYNKKENKSVQEIIEPENMKGIKITKQNNKITLENTQLNLSKIFEEYNGITQNDMDLENFLEDYNTNQKASTIEEKDGELIIETKSKNENKYVKNKTLYINQNTGNPVKMEIKDMNKKTTVYIVYNKVEKK